MQKKGKKKPCFSSPTSANDPSSPVGVISQKMDNEMIGLFKKEFCCLVCEEVESPFQRTAYIRNIEEGNKAKVEDPIVKCRGGCHNSFHLTCLTEDQKGTTKKLEEWKCKSCLTGKHECFVCKNTGTTSKADDSLGSIEKCSTAGCGKYYHRTCLKKYGLWPQAR